MNLTNAISDSLVAECYFGKGTEIGCYKAVPAVVVDGIKWAKTLASHVYFIDAHGVATPCSFSIEDILFMDWQLRDTQGDIEVDRPLYNGVVTVNISLVEYVTELFEGRGYGIIDAVQEIEAGNRASIFCRSFLFERVESGFPTPNYLLEYEEDTKTLTAQRIAV